MRFDWKLCCLPAHGTIRDAALIIGSGRLGIALVLGPNGQLVGTVTDGDIRRSLLGGAVLDDHVGQCMHRDFLAVSPGTGRAEVLDLMHAHGVLQIPVLGASGEPVGLHTLREIAGIEEKSNIAVILAGGRGTRLGDVTQSVPKPMLKVAGRPILERLVLHLVGHGIRRIFLSVHHLADVIESHFGDGSALGCRIEYLRENEPFGTGGCLSLLPEKPRNDIIVCNGDLVTQVDFDAMLRQHSERSAEATIGMHNHSLSFPFGVLELSGHRVVALQEKPTISAWVNAGVYVLSPDVLSRVPKGFFPITELIEDLIRRNSIVEAYPVEGEWIDIGERDQLAKARTGR
jgi:dTDP-glucose pyrophosphorylase